MKFNSPPELNDRIVKLGFSSDIAIPADIDFSPYQPGLREGVDIAVLFDETCANPEGADCAFLRYQAGAFVPGHVHMGYETVLVLQGDYIENGQTFSPGSFIVRAPGTCHSMASTNGCLILASRYKPVKQLTEYK
ncbi:cupin domain-containing protein [Pseudoalteromonas sp. MMG013]|uniref:cupin domain-containing protein n=1 Tax=unclassified Pseudoalteromonas TaxID=194690 RepID=UPI001B363B2B|nr:MULTISPECIES: cupin domain-containing protein [unclassified Pseudoalteromonas]MBQ4848364.1 cupin domain-containing protein [Pseudoalteromonas sp. MMG005]MBQ4864222.1 cupin domain-containing protein [Pseudoalteromonas sp. MMG013]